MCDPIQTSLDVLKQTESRSVFFWEFVLEPFYDFELWPIHHTMLVLIYHDVISKLKNLYIYLCYFNSQKDLSATEDVEELLTLLMQIALFFKKLLQAFNIPIMAMALKRNSKLKGRVNC